MERYTEVKQAQMLTGTLEYYTVMTPEALVIDDQDYTFGTVAFDEFYEKSRVWETIIEVFRMRANVVTVTELQEKGFTVAVEHGSAIDVADVQERIRALATTVYGGKYSTFYEAVVVNKINLDLIIDPDIAIEEVLPASGTVTLGGGGELVITIQASGSDVFALDVSHDKSDTVFPTPFTVFADEVDPYQDTDLQTEIETTHSSSVAYDLATTTWTITLDTSVVTAMSNAVEFTFVAKDSNGFGSDPEVVTYDWA